MQYAQLPIDLDEAPRNVDLDLPELGLLSCMLAYSHRNLTDGYIPDRAVRSFGKSGRGPRIASQLVSSGRLQRVSGGVQVVGYHDPDVWGQPTREEVLARRELARARKQAQRNRETAPRVTRDVAPPVTRHADDDVTRESPCYSTSLDSTPLHSTGTGARDFVLPKSEALLARTEWIDAFTRGVRTGGADPAWTFDPKTFTNLERVVRERLPSECRSRIAEWIEREAERFARATKSKASVYSNFAANGLERWFNGGCPAELVTGTPRNPIFRPIPAQPTPTQFPTGVRERVMPTHEPELQAKEGE